MDDFSSDVNSKVVLLGALLTEQAIDTSFATGYAHVQAIQEDYEVVVCDTSGRLHTNAQLMDELAKCKRAIGKRLAGAPHETLLVLDGTTGHQPYYNLCTRPISMIHMLELHYSIALNSPLSSGQNNPTVYWVLHAGIVASSIASRITVYPPLQRKALCLCIKACVCLSTTACRG